MQSLVLDRMGEAAGDDITLQFNLTLDGVEFPQDSAFQFIAELITDQTQEISVAGTISATIITVSIPKANTAISGIYNYKLRETTLGGLQRTPARGKFELVNVPVEG